MKKIYSLVLMAAMLLIGTGAWAADFSGTTRAELQAAIDAAATGTTIKLQSNVTLDGPIWLGTEDLTDAAKSITLDLNGHDVKMTGSNTNCYMFVLTHGELLIRNTNNNQSKIELTGTSKDGTQIVTVYGSYRSSRWNENGNALSPDSINTRVNGYISHLEIGENVKIVAGPNCLGAGLVVDALTSGNAGSNAAKLNGKTIKYFGDVFSSGHGFSYGTRVDVKGDIEVIGISSGDKKAYGIKVNGTVRSPRETKAIRTTKMNGVDNNYLINYDANRDNAGNGHCKDTIDAPYVHVYNTAKLVTNNGSSKSAAIYCSGYAKWLIEGTCEGNIGVSASSGTITINDANISSTATTYTPPTGNGSVSGSGSGLVVNSRDGYSGDMEVTISGNTEISAESGFGIEEAVTTKEGETKVDAITITGGTVSGGDAGTVLVTEPTAGSETTHITITGVTIEVDPDDEESTVQIGAQTLEEFLISQSEEETHVTYIDNGNGGQTMIISEGAAPTGEASVIAAAEDASVNWKHLDESTTAMSETLTANMNLAELEINQNYAQTLTIPDGKTLTVGRVVLGKNAQLVVEAGATLIVSGTQGISSSSDNCVVIENTETKQATFLLNPAVTSNAQPRGTVNMNVKYAGKDGSDYYWHRFAMPVKKLESAWTKSPNYGTYLYGWDYENNDWLLLPGGSTDMEAWQGYTLTYDQAYNEAEIVTYTFKGQLLGNVNANLQFKDEGYNFFGNSYTGYADAKTLLQNLLAGGNVRGTIYMWNENEQGYSAVSLARLNGPAERLEDYEKEVASMQTFIVQMAGANSASKTVNYADAIWNNPRYGNAPAPARRALAEADDDAFMKIVITAENGKSDFVTFTQNSSLSDAYDDGFDALKYMNNNRLNAYVTVDGADYTSVVSDNLIGKKLTLDTQNDVNYTISFKFVDGEEYAVRDNLNGQVTAIKEGNTYSFSAQPNTKIDGRFEIVGIENTITSISNTEANNEVRGIYTMLGQYVGEDFNALPAGVYIINGAKVVK